MRDKVFLPVGLIKKANLENWERSLSVFLRLKSLYQNNTHYEYTLRSLANRLAISPTCLSSHLKILLEKGLVYHHAGNLSFLGLKKLQEKFKQANIAVPVNHKNQLLALRAQILKFNLEQQEYNKIKKSGIKNCRTISTEKTSENYVGLSSKRIGDLFGLKASSGSRLRTQLRKSGFIKVKKKYRTIFKNVSIDHFTCLKKIGKIPFYAFLDKHGSILSQSYPEILWMQ